MEMTKTASRYQAGATAAVPVLAPKLDAGIKTITDVQPSEEALQVAIRLKVALGSDKRMIAVGGIKAEDGSSLLAASLGAAFASLDQSPVLIIDANNETSRLSAMFGAPEEAGLMNVLDDSAEVHDVCKQLVPNNLVFLSLGQSSRPLSTLIGEPRCRHVLEEIREHYRYILLDCGRVCESPSSILLASLSDGIVTAVAAATRRQNEIRSFQRTLHHLNIAVLGVVLTKGVGAKA